MKILYIANHGQIGTSADDEGAISFALRKLGHKVECVQEWDAERAIPRVRNWIEQPDLLLFHKWHNPLLLRKLNCIKVFWYFDLVDFPDPTLRGRCEGRIGWMKDILPLVHLGFCTDGDWVNKAGIRSDQIGQHSGKLVWLTQGFDERGIPCPSKPDQPSSDILFTGVRDGGQTRSSFVEEMQRVYSSRFTHIQRGIYGPGLAREIAYTRIVVAPDGPIGDYYWSNRVYNTLGYGGFLLHPYCKGLAEFQYTDHQSLVFYKSRAHLHDLIGFYNLGTALAGNIAAEGRSQTLANHTYRHRCIKLLEVVKERLGVG